MVLQKNHSPGNFKSPAWDLWAWVTTWIVINHWNYVKSTCSFRGLIWSYRHRTPNRIKLLLIVQNIAWEHCAVHPQPGMLWNAVLCEVPQPTLVSLYVAYKDPNFLLFFMLFCSWYCKYLYTNKHIDSAHIFPAWCHSNRSRYWTHHFKLSKKWLLEDIWSTANII